MADDSSSENEYVPSDEEDQPVKTHGKRTKKRSVKENTAKRPAGIAAPVLRSALKKDGAKSAARPLVVVKQNPAKPAPVLPPATKKGRRRAASLAGVDSDSPVRKRKVVKPGEEEDDDEDIVPIDQDYAMYYADIYLSDIAPVEPLREYNRASEAAQKYKSAIETDIENGEHLLSVVQPTVYAKSDFAQIRESLDRDRFPVRGFEFVAVTQLIGVEIAQKLAPKDSEILVSVTILASVPSKEQLYLLAANDAEIESIPYTPSDFGKTIVMLLRRNPVMPLEEMRYHLLNVFVQFRRQSNARYPSKIAGGLGYAYKNVSQALVGTWLDQFLQMVLPCGLYSEELDIVEAFLLTDDERTTDKFSITTLYWISRVPRGLMLNIMRRITGFDEDDRIHYFFIFVFVYFFLWHEKHAALITITENLYGFDLETFRGWANATLRRFYCYAPARDPTTVKRPGDPDPRAAYLRQAAKAKSDMGGLTVSPAAPRLVDGQAEATYKTSSIEKNDSEMMKLVQNLKERNERLAKQLGTLVNDQTSDLVYAANPQEYILQFELAVNRFVRLGDGFLAEDFERIVLKPELVGMIERARVIAFSIVESRHLTTVNEPYLSLDKAALPPFPDFFRAFPHKIGGVDVGLIWEEKLPDATKGEQLGLQFIYFQEALDATSYQLFHHQLQPVTLSKFGAAEFPVPDEHILTYRNGPTDFKPTFYLTTTVVEQLSTDGEYVTRNRIDVVLCLCRRYAVEKKVPFGGMRYFYQLKHNLRDTDVIHFVKYRM